MDEDEDEGGWMDEDEDEGGPKDGWDAGQRAKVADSRYPDTRSL